MIIEPFPIDLSGTWSTVQTKAILERFGTYANERGLLLRVFDISNHNTPNRFLIRAVCKRHECVVEPDCICPKCVRS